MSRIAAKYGTTFTKIASEQYEPGEVTGITFSDVKKLKVKKSDGRLGFRIDNEKDEKKFTVNLTHSAHDVIGLKDHDGERDGFHTSKLVQRSVTLAFDNVATADKAFNEVLKIDPEGLKMLMEGEGLQTLLKAKLDLFEVPMNYMKPASKWALAFSIPS